MLPTGPNELWVADITYIAITTGFVYLAAIRPATASARASLSPPTVWRAGHISSATTSRWRDAYLTWALLLVGQGVVRVAAWPSLIRYVDRMRQRPHVKAAIEIEQRFLRKSSQQTNSEPAYRYS